jgi:COMPASS component BRE2
MRDKTGEKITLSRPRPYGRPFSSGDVIGLYISLPPLRPPSKRDPHDPANTKRERIAIEFKGQEYFESLEYAQSKEMLALVDFSRKPPVDGSSVPPTTKKSATVKNVPERGTRGASSASGPTQMRTLPTLPESKIAFFINGQCQGVAFRELYDYRPLRTPADARKAQAKRRTREGAREHKENHFDDGSLGYFPLISLFNGARVRLNPGPDFAFPPPPDIDAALVGDDDPPLPDANASNNNAPNRTWRPLCERYAEFMEEQWELDEMEEEHAHVEAAQRAVNVNSEAEAKIERERKRAQASAKKRAKREEATFATSTAAGSVTAATATATAASTGHLNVAGAYGGTNTASTCTPQPEQREQSADVSTRPLLDPAVTTSTSALPSYMLNELHSHVETDQTSTGPSTPGPQSAYGSEYGDGEAEEQEQEQELGQEQEEDAPPDDLMDIYGDPAKLLQYRRAAAIRLEEEED